jgi:hypothetical protein
VPDGAIPFAKGPEPALRDFVEGLARHGYKTETVDGRPTKIPGTDMLLVPGIPEAQGNQDAALKALQGWLDWISKDPPKGIEVMRGRRG